MFEGMPKIVWMVWNQGEDDSEMHPLNRDCIRRWREFNPDWDVRVLDDQKLKEVIPEYFDITDGKSVLPATLSEVARLLLLRKFGGIWADASVYPMVALSHMLPKLLNDTGFFSYRFMPRSVLDKYGKIDPKGSREIVSWFLIADRPNHPLIVKWADKYLPRFKDWPENPKYFQMHDDLAFLYDTDQEVKFIVDHMVQMSEKIPHSASGRWRKREPSFLYKRPKRYCWRNNQSTLIPNIESL